jgi:RNA polymerase sigma-70 factor (ECF subfamily)
MIRDEDLMLACGRGSADALARLFERYRQPLWSFFRRRVGDRARAEELAQDVFVALLKSAKRYEPRAPFRTYLFGIAFRMWSAERRRSRAALDRPTQKASPASLDHADEGLWVRQALSRLDDDDREVIMLREFEQLSYEEIAALLHMPINTVRSRLFRARAALRELLAPAAPAHEAAACSPR